MAKWCTLLLVVLIAAAGCQQRSAVSMVDNLPPPNFGGPAFAERSAAPAPPPTESPKIWAQPAPSKPSADAIPAAWIPWAPTNRWYWIVIHHSATPVGGAERFNKEHRAKGWDELGYHFVIGNGTDTADGKIEVGPRWPKQKWGAHDKTPGNQYNEHGIGICLVGNFDVSRPSPAQIKSLEKLVAYLMKTYRIPADRVLGHGETKPTDCPGRFMNVAMIRRACSQIAFGPNPVEADGRTARIEPGQELLVDRGQ